jgi:hypothetical protein
MALRFAASETTLDYLVLFEHYLQRFGRPLAVYSDRHSIFRVNTGTRSYALTQVGRALRELGIELICATTPQAKGRVERANRTLQTRLVRELRLRNISTISEANSYLEEFREDYNHRFAEPPAQPEDAHRTAAGFDLPYICAVRFTRRLSKDCMLRLRNDIVVAERQDLRGGEIVEVIEHIGNRFGLRLADAQLPFRRVRDVQSHAQLATSKELNERVDRRKHQPAEPRKGHAPPADHPWRRTAFRAAPSL